MSLDERRVGGLRIVIDRDQCVGFGDCAKEAPEGFKLDADTVAVFVTPEVVERERLLRACDACPVDAITVYDESGSAPAWSAEAQDRLARIPGFVRGMVKRIYADYAKQRGIAEITPAVMDTARTDLGLEGM